MSKRVAILQSSYIPWKGYFDIIHDVDEFIFLDDVQYTKHNWRNRNRIKTTRGPRWLTIPVGQSQRRRICDVSLPAADWARDHLRTIEDAYGAAPHLATCRSFLEELYLEKVWDSLSDFNQSTIRKFATLLGIRTQFRDSREFAVNSSGETRVLELLLQTGATTYVSGPAARAYLHEKRFADAGIELVWKDYFGYPEYPQVHPPFVHEVTIIDLLVHTGPAATDYIWGWR